MECFLFHGTCARGGLSDDSPDDCGREVDCSFAPMICVREERRTTSGGYGARERTKPVRDSR